MPRALTEAGRASMIMPKSAKSELDDLPMASAKPSAIREAAKQARLASQAERVRVKAASQAEGVRVKARQHRDAEQQMKMQRYRDEIAVIKNNQKSGSDTETTGRKKRTSQLALDVAEKALSKEVTPSRESAVLGYTNSDFSSGLISDEDVSLDEMSLDDEDFEAKKHKFDHLFSPKTNAKKVMREMNKSFRTMDLTADDADEKSKKSLPSVPASISAMAVSREPPRQREYTADGDGRLRTLPARSSSRRLVTRNKSPSRQASILVPEMRRRPMQRDLLFDDDQVKLAKERGNTKAYRGNTSDYRRGSVIDLNKKKLSDKQEQEKEEIMEQRKKLDEAEKAFDKGHNLCWEIHDSASALGHYRNALFIRESLLGKYHEQTGRTYFWIGKSLAKLGEFSEALVAYSRALRIFERVVRKSHKYHKWAILAIENCIEGLNDDDIDVETYKATLDASIKDEREGDAHRKKGERAEAVAKYRDAIDGIEENHPDAADLYCKVALIFRQDGDHERALEEYRFASEIYELSLGADHPETVRALNQVMEKKRLGQLSNMLKEKLNLKT